MQPTAFGFCVTEIGWTVPIQQAAAQLAEAAERVLIEHLLALNQLFWGPALDEPVKALSAWTAILCTVSDRHNLILRSVRSSKVEVTIDPGHGAVSL